MRYSPLVALALATLGVVFAAEATPDPALNWVVQGGSFAALVYVIFHLLKFTIPSYQKQAEADRVAFQATLDRMANRHDVWEQLRHEDSQLLRESMKEQAASQAEMAKTCARVHALAQIRAPQAEDQNG